MKGKKETDKEDKNNKLRKQVCWNELSQEHLLKLTSTLEVGEEATNMVYYLSINDGFKVLVDSLYFNTRVLSLIERLLEKDKKL